MGEAFAINTLADVGTALYAANQARNLAEPHIQMADSGMARQAMGAGGAGRQENPYLAAMQKAGSGQDAPRFDFVPFQDWFRPSPKRW